LVGVSLEAVVALPVPGDWNDAAAHHPVWAAASSAGQMGGAQ
jgi:hypothetical protein